jgi:hypothetical protein
MSVATGSKVEVTSITGAELGVKLGSTTMGLAGTSVDAEGAHAATITATRTTLIKKRYSVISLL